MSPYLRDKYKHAAHIPHALSVSPHTAGAVGIVWEVLGAGIEGQRKMKRETSSTCVAHPAPLRHLEEVFREHEVIWIRVRVYLAKRNQEQRE